MLAPPAMLLQLFYNTVCDIWALRKGWAFMDADNKMHGQCKETLRNFCTCC